MKGREGGGGKPGISNTNCRGNPLLTGERGGGLLRVLGLIRTSKDGLGL